MCTSHKVFKSKKSGKVYSPSFMVQNGPFGPYHLLPFYLVMLYKSMDALWIEQDRLKFLKFKWPLKHELKISGKFIGLNHNYISMFSHFSNFSTNTVPVSTILANSYQTLIKLWDSIPKNWLLCHMWGKLLLPLGGPNLHISKIWEFYYPALWV